MNINNNNNTDLYNILIKHNINKNIKLLYIIIKCEYLFSFWFIQYNNNKNLIIILIYFI